MNNPYDITVKDPRELSSDNQSEIMREADEDFLWDKEEKL